EVLRLGRRGKYLVWALEGEVFLAQHLRMTGALLWNPSPEPIHARVRIELEPRALIVVTDPRRFGTGELLLGEEALEAFFDARGASIDDFRHIDGLRGAFQDRFLVHRRAGEPCVRCGQEIRKLVVAGRGTYVCERCQPRPRARRGSV